MSEEAFFLPFLSMLISVCKCAHLAYVKLTMFVCECA